MPPPDPASARPRRRLPLTPTTFVVGLGLVAVGLAGYDPRLACIAVGVVLVAAAVTDALLSRRRPRSAD